MIRATNSNEVTEQLSIENKQQQESKKYRSETADYHKQETLNRLKVKE